jgi:hypothetical protein
MVTMTTARWATAPVAHGLNVREQGRLLHGAAAAMLSSRERAGVLTERALAGAPPTARSLVLELDGSHGLCVLAMGDRPAAVWRLELGALRALAATAGADLPRPGGPTRVRQEASRLILGTRLAALRGSIGDIVVVHQHPDTLSQLVGAALLDAIVEHLWADEVGAATLAS